MKFTENDQISDPRFAAIQNDPRFKRPTRKQAKVKLDSRFSHLLSSNEFEFVQKVDRYGRPAQLSRERVDLKKFYRAADDDSNEDDDNNEGQEGKKAYKPSIKGLISPTEKESEDLENSVGESQSDADTTMSGGSGGDSEDSEGEEDQESIGRSLGALARGEVLLSSSESEDEASEDRHLKFAADEESDEEIDDDDIIRLSGPGGANLEEEEEVDAGNILQRDDVPLGEETRRFAAVNMDWDVLRAQDLMKLFDAFKPANGVIYSVKIFPSEFGKERLAEEERSGPPKEIFIDQIESERTNGKVLEEILENSDIKEEFNQAKLRRYQLERLRYFYAVVECDSVKTAKTIFEQCDGSEYESSSVFIDLRYIPDDVQFEDKPKDVCTEVPVAFRPKEFVTAALQHSKVKLTWDEDDPERLMVTRKKFTKDVLKDMDFKAYLASDIDESEDEDAVDVKVKYKSLLNAASSSEDESEEKKEEEFEDMEITFAPGLSNLANKLLEAKKEKSLRQNETVFETFLREKKEKKKAKKKGKEQNDLISDDEERDMADMEKDDFFKDAFGKEFEDPSSKEKSKPPAEKGKKLNGKKRKLAEEDVDPDLELVFMDENGKNNHRKHFDMDEIVKTGKKNEKKKKISMGENGDDFDVNVSDDRFKALFDSSEYAIDPTSAKFKKTKAMDRLLKESRDRHSKRLERPTESTVSSGSDLKFLVNKLKRTADEVQTAKGKRTGTK